MIAEIQVLPTPPGTADSKYAHVEAAIGVIEASGLKYEVGALGTTVEGEADAVWALLRAAHEAVLAAGAGSVVSVIKVGESSSAGMTIEGLTGKFR
ncbi:MAG: thiamine-binding protein [Tepidiformaceae bacterium]